MPLLVLFYFGPYLVPVVPAYWLVRRRGRPFHESDLVAIFAPIGIYLGFEVCDSRQGVNALGATLLTGSVVAACCLFRVSRSLSPWKWAVVTTVMGSLTGFIAWLSFADARLAVPLF